MGARNFFTATLDHKRVDAAYRHLVFEALRQHGHDPYNGTISTTDGYDIARVTPMTVDEAAQWAVTEDANGRSPIDACSKWEDCLAIPLVASTNAQYETTGTHTVTLTIPGARPTEADKITAAAKALKVKPELIASVKAVQAVRESRLKSTPGSGKAVTKYFVVDPRDGRLPAWKDGYPSQAEARAVLNRTATREYGDHLFDHTDEWEVFAMTRREDGSPLLTGARGKSHVTGTFTVTTRRLVTKATRGTEVIGWAFAGWAAS